MNYAENLLRHPDDDHIAYYYTSERIKVGTHHCRIDSITIHNYDESIFTLILQSFLVMELQPKFSFISAYN